MTAGNDHMRVNTVGNVIEGEPVTRGSLRGVRETSSLGLSLTGPRSKRAAGLCADERIAADHTVTWKPRAINSQS